MAEAVAQAIATRGPLIAEAGTGTGKTFAYLVPALLFGGKVDRLHRHQDAAGPALPARPADGARRAARAGRRSRCSRDARTTSATIISSDRRGGQPSCRATMLAICRGSSLRARDRNAATAASSPTFRKTRRSGRWSRRRATTASAANCAHYANCFVLKARKDALEADVVVVNHHLFFADVMLRDEGSPSCCRRATRSFSTRPHQLPDTATLFFGETATAGAARRSRARRRGCGADRRRAKSPTCRTPRRASGRPYGRSGLRSAKHAGQARGNGCRHTPGLPGRA